MMRVVALLTPARVIQRAKRTFAVNMMDKWHYKKVDVSNKGYNYTHSWQGWPFARTLKYRLKAKAFNTSYVSKQEATRQAGLQPGTRTPPPEREPHVDALW